MNISKDSNSTHSPEDLLYLQYIVYTGADSINLIFGFLANFYILRIIVTGERGMVASDFFALNLAVSDMLTCVSSLMFILHNHIYNPNQESGPLWGIALFFKGFILAGRPLFQCCICLERYLAVVHPVTFLMYKPLRYRVACCGVVWVMILGCCFAYLFESTYTANILTLCLILLTCSVMLFCCLALLRVLKRPRPGDVEGDCEGNSNMKLRAFRIILAILVSMIIMYLPVALTLILYFNIELVIYTFGRSVCFSITVVTGFVQPLLYLHRAGKLPCIKDL